MEYTVDKLAKLAGISSRTIRYYDEIGLLKPARINSSGYRIYGENEVNTLQQILFYRELGVDLHTIKQIINSPGFDHRKALLNHYQNLLKKKQQLELLISNVEKTMAAAEGRIIMADKEKFIGFKQRLIEENETHYGKEIREKYGEEAVDRSNQRLMNMKEEEWARLEEINNELKKTLQMAVKEGNPAGELAQKACELHKKWLMFFWSDYSREAHLDLAQMYVEDERFAAYYEAIEPGSAVFLRDALRIYTGLV